MKTSKKPSLEDLDAGVEPQAEKILISLPELAEMIENRWTSPPAKDNKKAYHFWKQEINSLIGEYNFRVGFKAFKNAH